MAACSSGDVVAVDAPSPSGASLEHCSALDQQLPDRVAGLEARAVEPSSPFTAAWGDPAVRLRCGVPRVEPDATASLVDVGRITWRVRQVGGDVVWLTEGRLTAVELRVPQSYDAQDVVLSDLEPSVAAAVPVDPDAPPADGAPPADAPHDDPTPHTDATPHD